MLHILSAKNNPVPRKCKRLEVHSALQSAVFQEGLSAGSSAELKR
jgi:hypothetical protein